MNPLLKTKTELEKMLKAGMASNQRLEKNIQDLDAAIQKAAGAKVSPSATPVNAASGAEPKRRGRPPKAATAPATPMAAALVNGDAPKRRGRPPKSVAAPVVASEPKRRGRPPKAESATPAPATATSASGDAPKRRGRPPGSKAATPTAQKTAAAKSGAPAASGAPAKRRGRPPGSKAATPTAQKTVAAKSGAPAASGEPAKRRGRPPKAAGDAPTANNAPAAGSGGEAKRRGRPPKTENAGLPDTPESFWVGIMDGGKKNLDAIFQDAVAKLGSKFKADHTPRLRERMSHTIKQLVQDKIILSDGSGSAKVYYKP